MRTVYKYEVAPQTEGRTYEIPFDGNVVTYKHVGFQGQSLMVWVEVDTEKEALPYTFYAYGTGWQIPERPYLAWVGSATLDGMMWHVFVESPS